jgi:hypothetical protein
LKTAVFWVGVLCSLVTFTGISEVLAASIIITHHPDYGGSKQCNGLKHVVIVSQLDNVE